MKEFGDSISIIFSKVAGFFDIFDLSFFVSGLLSGMAVATFLYYAGIPVASLLNSKTGIFIAVVMCYGFGLASFAMGRLIQNVFGRIIYKKPQDIESDERFIKYLKNHDLYDNKQVKKYIDQGADGTRALYNLLWAQLRHSPNVSSSLELLNSYWVRAATYDGLSVSLLLWSAVMGCSYFDKVIPHFEYPALIIVGLVIVISFAFACLWEGQRYRKYQAKELVATIAAITGNQ